MITHKISLATVVRKRAFLTAVSAQRVVAKPEMNHKLYVIPRSCLIEARSAARYWPNTIAGTGYSTVQLDFSGAAVSDSDSS